MTQDEVIRLMGEELQRLKARKKFLSCSGPHVLEVKKIEKEQVQVIRCERCSKTLALS